MAKDRTIVRAVTILLLLAGALGSPLPVAGGHDLEDGDIFVSAAEGRGSFGLTGPRIIWRVRDGVAERYVEGSPDGNDNAFFEVPDQMIVDSHGRIVFVAALGAHTSGLFRVDGMGSTPERLAVFSNNLGPVNEGFPDPFPDRTFNAISGLHLATVQTIEINADRQRLYTQDAYVMALREFGGVNETKVRRYSATTGQWDVAPDAASWLSSMPVMVNHGGATYSSAGNVLRRSTDPLRLDVEGNVGGVDFELHAALFGGFKEVSELILDESALPNVPSGVDPSLPSPPSHLEPFAGGYSVMSIYDYDIAHGGPGGLGLVLRAHSGLGSSPYLLTNVSEALINDDPTDDLGDYFYRSTTGHLPTASLKYTSIAPGDDPDTAENHFNYIALGSMALTPQGLVGASGDRLVRVVSGEGLEIIASGFVAPRKVAVYPAVVPPASGTAVVIQINSPVDVLVTDAAGNRIGVDPATGMPVNDFGQNAFDSGPGEPRFLVLKNPAAGLFDVEAVGTGDGPYSIQVYAGLLGQTETDLNQISVGGIASPGSAGRHLFTMDSQAKVAVISAADFDSDGDVDGADFLVWQRGLGSPGARSQGDANNDGNVTAEDLGVWRQQFASATASAAAVPEPSALTSILLASGFAWPARRAKATGRARWPCS